MSLTSQQWLIAFGVFLALIALHVLVPLTLDLLKVAPPGTGGKMVSIQRQREHRWYYLRSARKDMPFQFSAYLHTTLILFIIYQCHFPVTEAAFKNGSSYILVSVISLIVSAIQKRIWPVSVDSPARKSRQPL